MTGLRVVSYGGGVQSTALLVLAAQGRIDFKTFLMANVGDDSEHPATLEYVRNIAMPYAEKHGIELTEISKRRRDGTTQTLWQKAMEKIVCPACRGRDDDRPSCERCGGSGRAESRSIPLPVRMSNGAPGNRTCTVDFKIKVVAKELRRRGATEDEPAIVGIGISLDEIMRANGRTTIAHERVVYPLIGIGEETGLAMTRQDCMNLIRAEGLPVPPKSSCFFCPFHRPSAWEDLQRERPDLFEKSVLLERTLNARREELGKNRVWLTRFARPLDEAIQAQDLLPLTDVSDADGQCDSGWCWT